MNGFELYKFHLVENHFVFCLESNKPAAAPEHLLIDESRSVEVNQSLSGPSDVNPEDICRLSKSSDEGSDIHPFESAEASLKASISDALSKIHSLLNESAQDAPEINPSADDPFPISPGDGIPTGFFLEKFLKVCSRVWRLCW